MSANNSRSKRVKVWVRTRPTAKFAHEIIDLQRDGKAINIHCGKDNKRGVVNNQRLDWSFKVDGVLHNASQEAVYQSVAANLVDKALDGYNGTILCYGQTGAGKTFTMTGATENFTHRGLIPRALAHIFRETQQRPEYSFTIRLSYLEIYNETMYDLLGTLPESVSEDLHPMQMTVVEDSHGVYVKGLTSHLAQSEEDALSLLFEGETNRAIAEHSLNSNSSRSHCIFTIYIETRSRVQSSATYTVSKLNFVDLAGSERLKKTKSEGRTQQEAMYINKSLTFLEQAVIALADKGREHIPFRQSKLTHFLKDSIGGNCNTVMIANIWGEAQQLEETTSTLRFASRMMCVAITPAVNEQYDPMLLIKKLEKEIRALKQELAMHDTLVNRQQVAYEPLSEQQRYEIAQQVRQYAKGSLDEIDIVNVRQIQAVFEAFREYSSNVEKEVNERLSSKYMMIDKSDPAAIAAAQQAGLPVTDEGELVGEPDGSGFGVGPAPSSARPNQSSVANAKRKEKGKQRSVGRASSSAQSTGRGGPTDGSISQTPSADKKDEREGAGTPTSTAGIHDMKDAKPPRPSTPPSRTEAFEEFKQEMGSEINRILQENKEILGAKKKAYSDLARQINHTKSEIDSSVGKLEQLRSEREAEGTMTNDDGEIIISEAEYLEIQRLKDLKATYRTDFEELKALKIQVQYCQKLVDQCRMRLLQEFDNWYANNFLSDNENQTSLDVGVGERLGPGSAKRPSSHTTIEDEQEKVERLQMALLMENPDSVAFYNAKMRIQQRKIYEAAVNQATMKRPPGTPTRTIKSRPPNLLHVQ